MTPCAIIDDSPFWLEYYAALLTETGQWECRATAGSIEDFFALAPKKEVRVLFLDIQLPGLSGIEAIPALLNVLPPDAEIIMLTVLEKPDLLLAALQRGASGYLVKNKQKDAFL